jgi:predicted transcriptional regulator
MDIFTPSCVAAKMENCIGASRVAQFDGCRVRESISSNGDYRMKPKLGPAAKKTRVTFVLPDVIDRALEQHCSVTGRPKNEVASEAITTFLTRSRDERNARIQQLDADLAALAHK